MDINEKHQSHGTSVGIRVWMRAIALAVLLLAVAPSVGLAEGPNHIPLTVQPMLEVQVQVRSAGQLQQLQSMGLSCAGMGSCRLEVSDAQVMALKQAGLEYAVLQHLVKLTLPAPGGGPESLQSVSQLNATDVPIPDYSGGVPGYAQSSVLISTAPTGATVNSVQYQLRVQHSYPNDLQLTVSCDLPAYQSVLVWNRLGGGTDGGFDDDPEDDDDIFLLRSEFDEFDGSPVNQTWYLEASDGAADDSGWIDFFEMRIYFCVNPGAPTALSPAAQSHICDTTPDFDWSDVSGAVEYRIQVDDDASFAHPVINSTSPVSSYTPASPLLPGEYHWRVRADDECGHSAWSSILTFDIDSPPAAPLLTSPADASQTCDHTPLCQWSGVGGATVYQIQVDNDLFFTSPEVDESVSVSNLELDFLEPGQYLWRVRASNNCGNGPWSGVWSFVVEPLLTTAPTLASPANGSHTCDITPTMAWNGDAAADMYRLQVDDDASFSSPEFDGTTTATNYPLPTALAPGSYNWRVRSSNFCGNSPWSAPWTITIDGFPAPPSGPSPADGATGVALNADLDWADAAGATSYDVYFSAIPLMPKVGTVTSSQYNLGLLWSSTRYYWRIMAKNSCGETPGPAWSFTTGASANHPPENFNLWPDHGGRDAGRRVNFTATHRDLDGWRDLRQVYLHIGSGTAKRSSCRLRYDVRSDKMYLLDNAGGTWLGGFAPGSAKVIRNRQCTLSCAKSTVTKSGRTVKVQWNLVFRTSFRGTKDSYMHATDMQGAKTPWEKMGTYRVK